MPDIFDIHSLGATTTLNRDRLFGQVAELLGRRIVAGAYPAAHLLPNEMNLGADVEVSRTAYREAIKILTAKGMVEARPKSGTRVTPRESWNLLDPDVLSWQLAMNPTEAIIHELFDLRLIIEPNAARLAAERRTTEQLAAIDAAMEIMETETPFSDSVIRADVEFHRTIFAAAGNQALACLAHVVVSTIQWSMLLQSVRSTETFIKPLWDHKRVRNAIAEKNSKMAGSMMEVLVIESLDTTIKIFQTYKNANK